MTLLHNLDTILLVLKNGGMEKQTGSLQELLSQKKSCVVLPFPLDFITVLCRREVHNAQGYGEKDEQDADDGDNDSLQVILLRTLCTQLLEYTHCNI